METVKAAAKTFAGQLYYPYDRLGVVTFDQFAHVKLGLSTDLNEIEDTLADITVFEGGSGTQKSDGITVATVGTRCIYYRDYKNINPALTGGVDLSAPWAYNPNAAYWDYNDVDNVAPHNQQYPQELAEYPPSSGAGWPFSYLNNPYPYGPCRLFDHNNGGFLGFDCPMYYGTDPDPSRCGSTNIAAGISQANLSLLGTYPNTYVGTLPERRDDSVWVLVLLTDGAANAAYSSGTPLCPHNTWVYRSCRSLNPEEYHTSSDPLYDAKDQAHDMFKTAASDNITIYTIGLGNLVKLVPGYASGYPAPGETLLKYPVSLGGQYFYAQNGSDLTPIFLAIADLITSRINQ